MESETVRFADLLDRDIAHKGINQADLPRMLTEDAEPPITEAAISMWKRRNSVPPKRLRMLIEIFGPESELARAFRDGSLRPNVSNLTINYRAETGKDRGVSHDPAKQRDRDEVRARSDARRAAYSQKERDIVLAMPENLQKNFEGTVGAGALQFRYDYMSENAVVEISIHTTGIMTSTLYRPLFRLALAQRLRNAPRPCRYGLIVLLDHSDSFMNGIERVKTEAALMGLEFVVVDSPEKAAKVIEVWETTRPDQGLD